MCPESIIHNGVQLRLCPLDLTDGKPLYCSRDGHFYNKRLREIKHSLCKSHENGGHRGGSKYPFMRQCGSVDCHKLMAYTWIGPKPGADYVIDHINGDKMNYSADNLEWVTTTENTKRAVILRVLRKNGRDPKTYSPARLKLIFSAPFDIISGEQQIDREMERHCEC